MLQTIHAQLNINTDLEIIESIHKSFKQSCETYKKHKKLQEGLISGGIFSR